MLDSVLGRFSHILRTILVCLLVPIGLPVGSSEIVLVSHLEYVRLIFLNGIRRHLEPKNSFSKVVRYYTGTHSYPWT